MNNPSPAARLRVRGLGHEFVRTRVLDDIHFELLAFRSYQSNQIESIVSILKYQLTTTALLDDMVIAVNRDFPRGPSHTHLLLYR